MEVHPSQRRISCNTCRRNKAKCQRLRDNDPRCVRCTLANEDCEVGQQRKVGRPRGKEPTKAFAVRTCSVTNGRRCPEHPGSGTSSVNTARSSRGVSVYNPSASLKFGGSNTDTWIDGSGASHQNATGRPLTLPSTTETLRTETLGWPTFVTERWYRSKIAPGYTAAMPVDPTSHATFGAHGGHLTAGPPLNSSYENKHTSVSATPRSVNRIQQPHLPLDLHLEDPFFSDAAYRPQSLVTDIKRALPFGMGKPPAYYVHENRFSSDSSKIPRIDIAADGSGAIVRLISITFGLRQRSEIVQNKRASLNLNLIVHREGPLFIGSFSLAEYVMVSAQDLEQIVGCWNARSQTGYTWDKQLLACFIATVLDVYCSLLAFFGLFLEHLTARAERAGTDPTIPIPGLTFNGKVLTGPCTQGTLFCSAVYYLLGRLENVLGLGGNPGSGLLSPSQVDVLYERLDESEDLAQAKGIIRPTDARKLFAQVATLLEQLASPE